MAGMSLSPLGNKPLQTLGGSRTSAAKAYGGASGIAPAQIGAGQVPAANRVYQTGTTGSVGGFGLGPDGMVSAAGSGVRPNNPTMAELNPTMPTPDYSPDVPRYAAPSPGSGGGGGDGGPGGLGLDEIMGVLDKLKPAAPPAREQAPGLLAREAAPQPIANPAAKSQGFARAKDNAGRVANSALRNLRSEMVSRGIEGSGVEGQLAGNILGETARGVSDASFQQERAAEDQAWQAAQLGYQGAISQRANDYGIMGTGYSGGVSQRGQDIGATPDMLQLAPTILNLLSRQRY